jgi:prepilin-type processing-associated H-X9-DG protein
MKTCRGALRLEAHFTLIELMIVVSIMSMLMAMLIPTLKRAMETARTISCAGNLKQIGLTSNLYSAENGDFIPYLLYSGPGYSPMITYDDLIASYLGKKLTQAEFNGTQWNSPCAPLRCPSDGLKRAFGYPRSYSPVLGRSCGSGTPPAGGPNNTDNDIWGIACPAYDPSFGYGNWAASSIWSPRFGSLQAPSGTFMFAERVDAQSILGNYTASGVSNPSTYSSDAINNGRSGYLFHNKQQVGNFLYCDGHSRTLSLQDTYGANGTFTTPRGPWTRVSGD